jgi:alkylation response protein AidB-like acyl-CoA dehydrogenase
VSDMTESSFMFDHGPAALRAELRQLIADELPAGWLGPFTEDRKDLALSNRFCGLLAERGLLVPEWPAEFGGQGLELERGIVIREEMWASCEPRGAQYYGPNWVGPSIMRHGTAEQRAQHLPAIAAGKVIWCQGFSEPEAGSDLRALRTRAVPHKDGFRITGQKVWTSWARWAQWCYLLARVPGYEDEPHGGVTVFLIPMDRDGIIVRAIDGLPGPHHLNEVFLDDVWAHRSEVLGAVGNGWDVIRDALANERVGIARYARSDRVLSAVAPIVRSADASGSLRAQWTEARVRNRISRLVCRYALFRQRNGGTNDFPVSAARLITTQADQFAADVAADALTDRFFEDRYTADAPLGGLVEFVWRYSRAATIASGTSEMLRILLWRGLQRGQRLDAASESADVGEAFTSLVEHFGRTGAARSARSNPKVRLDILEAVRGMLAGLDPRVDYPAALQAGEVCRRAGRAALPVPIEGILLCRQEQPVALASSGGMVEHGDLLDRWTIGTRAGGTVTATFSGVPLGTRLGAFVTTKPFSRLDDAEPLTPTELALAHSLPPWYILGTLETALDLAVRYAQSRVQFGAAISTYQGVSFPLADLAADLHGLLRLAEFTLWRAVETPYEALVDALALRWAALDIARRALLICHQVLGAIGLTEEHDLALLTSAIQPRLRMPLTLGETLEALIAAIDERGFDCIFPPAREQDREGLSV